MRDVADTQGNGRGPRRQGRPDPGGPWEREPVGALPLTVGSLFAGIGGFDLGLERAGMRTVWFCEQDPFCRRVLARHWPGVPCHPDVRALVADTQGGRERKREPARLVGELDGVRADADVPVPVSYVDVLCGGFPCQDISLAGRGAGLAGERSGLWREFARLIGELRPRYVIVENVPALTHRGLDVVLADLAACGFDAEWDHLPASAFGAPHRRDRIWLVAYPNADGERLEERGERNGRSYGPELEASQRDDPGRFHAAVADAARHGAQEQTPAGTVGERTWASGERGGTREVADAEGERRERPFGEGSCRGQSTQPVGHGGADQPLAHANGTAGNGARPAGEALPRPGEIERPGRRGSGEWHPWLTEPDVGRVAHGIPARVDRLRSLGNALVPQIAEWIGRQILEWERVSA